MRILWLLASFAVALTVSSCDESALNGTSLTSPHRGAVNGSGFTIDRAAEVEFVFSVQQNGPTAIVCGTYKRTGPVFLQISRRIMNDIDIYSGTTPLVEGIRFFRLVTTEEELLRGPANCVDTGIPWQASFGTTRPSTELNRTTTAYR